MQRVEFLLNVAFFRGFVAVLSMFVFSTHIGAAMAEDNVDPMMETTMLTVAEESFDSAGPALEDTPVVKSDDGSSSETKPDPLVDEPQILTLSGGANETSDTPAGDENEIMTLSSSSNNSSAPETFPDIVSTMDNAAQGVDGMFFRFEDGGSIMNGLLQGDPNAAINSTDAMTMFVEPAVAGAFDQLMQSAQFAPSLPTTLP